VSRFTLEFYTDEAGDQPVLRWLREDLSATQRRAIGVALREILEAEAIAVCRGGYDKGTDPSKRRQQQEITVARRRLADFRRRNA
jgi:hypothetical protein